ncbi:hypothetical protein ACQJ8B_00100 [Helicobacter pylori]
MPLAVGLVSCCSMELKKVVISACNNELTPLVSFAKRLYIVCIDSVNADNENIAELKHASENYDELKGVIKRFQLKHDSVALLELESFVNRDTKADKDLLLDFIGL